MVKTEGLISGERVKGDVKRGRKRGRIYKCVPFYAFNVPFNAHWAWQPRHISWWIGFINLLGCIAFLVSAVFAFVPPHPPGFDAVTWSLWFTLLGALAFMAGALLMLPETAAAR